MHQENTGYRKSRDIIAHNRRYLAGGLVSMNREISPMRVFVRGRGAYIWDAEGNRYVDYHGAFSPHLLGHNDPDVNAAVMRSLQADESLIGAGTTPWEGELAELLVTCVPSMEQVQLTNSGSEATFHALRLARAATGRDSLIIIQGGYNGWHNDVAFNLMDTVEEMGPGPIPIRRPISAGIPKSVWSNVNIVQYNDAPGVASVLETENIAAVLLEPVLQNVGVVLPLKGYLQELRELCDRHDVLLIFDEVKTGFRHGLGGYQALCNVTPDLTTLGKAVANGYPLGVIGGRKEIMEHFYHAEKEKRVLIAGTYNGHPLPVAAAIATLRKLMEQRSVIYQHLESLGDMMERGLREIVMRHGVSGSVARLGSALNLYFMEHKPTNWAQIVALNDMERDRRFRQALVEEGIFFFPIPVKQVSISFAHSMSDIDHTLDACERVISKT